jgi:hypothetical protein
MNPKPGTFVGQNLWCMVLASAVEFTPSAAEDIDPRIVIRQLKKMVAWLLQSHLLPAEFPCTTFSMRFSHFSEAYILYLDAQSWS